MEQAEPGPARGQDEVSARAARPELPWHPRQQRGEVGSHNLTPPFTLTATSTRL